MLKLNSFFEIRLLLLKIPSLASSAIVISVCWIILGLQRVQMCLWDSSSTHHELGSSFTAVFNLHGSPHTEGQLSCSQPGQAACSSLSLCFPFGWIIWTPEFKMHEYINYFSPCYDQIPDQKLLNGEVDLGPV